MNGKKLQAYVCFYYVTVFNFKNYVVKGNHIVIVQHMIQKYLDVKKKCSHGQDIMCNLSMQ